MRSDYTYRHHQPVGALHERPAFAEHAEANREEAEDQQAKRFCRARHRGAGNADDRIDRGRNL